MPLLGAHMSIAGGLHKAVEAAAALGMETVQIFTYSPSQWAIKPVEAASAKSLRARGKPSTQDTNQWRASPLGDQDVARFRQALEAERVVRPVAHASYLLNLASPDDLLWHKSLEAFVAEMQRAEQLGLDALVIHPGSYTTSNEADGLLRVIASVDEMHRRTSGLGVRCLLETTAGQGTNLGYRFEQLAAIIEGVELSERLGVCFDTCHVFAAGYGLVSRRDYLATMREFERVVGTKRIEAFHLNDSKREQGSRVDRHEHIGLGQLGLEAFRHVLNDRRFRNTPMYLETAKGNHQGESWDQINLRRLRELIA